MEPPTWGDSKLKYEWYPKVRWPSAIMFPLKWQTALFSEIVAFQVHPYIHDSSLFNGDFWFLVLNSSYSSIWMRKNLYDFGCYTTWWTPPLDGPNFWSQQLYPWIKNTRATVDSNPVILWRTSLYVLTMKRYGQKTQHSTMSYKKCRLYHPRASYF